MLCFLMNVVVMVSLALATHTYSASFAEKERKSHKNLTPKKRTRVSVQLYSTNMTEHNKANSPQ